MSEVDRNNVDENVQVVKDFFAAVDRVDEAALVKVCADDIEWTIPGQWDWAGTHRGLPGVRELFKKAFATVEITSSERHAFVAQGDRVMVIGVAWGRMQGTDITFEDHFVFSIQVRNGKVATLREYIDTQAVSQAFEKAAQLKSKS